MPIFQETRTTEIEGVLEPGRGGSRARSGGRRGGARFGSARVSEVQDAIQQAPYGTELSSEELAAHRAVLLSQKQVDLESTIDRHDDMVRELFHMENFRNMTLYNPKVAKNDRAPVFMEFKAQYDLVDSTAPVAGPSRRTRGQANERRQTLQSNTIPPPPISLSTKRTLKNKAADRPELENILLSARSYKGKGKGKEAPAQPLTERVEPLSTAIVNEPTSSVISRRKPPPSTPRLIARNVDIQSPSANESISTQKSPLRKSNGANVRVLSLKRPAPVPVDVLEQTEKPPFISSEVDHEGSLNCPKPADTPTAVFPNESVSANLSKRSWRLHDPPPPKPFPSPIRLKVRPPPAEPVQTSTPPFPDVSISSPIPVSSPVFKVKRIKLIVRRPPPTLTDPRQRPPPPKFNNSLPQFLNSYISIDDAEPNADADALARAAQAEAATRARVECFRIAGRFIPGTDVLFGTVAPATPYTPPQRTTRDIWDDVVDAVIATAKARPKRPIGRVVAAQVASRIQAHFAGKETRRTKARVSEEKQLRVLARNTIRAVVMEWKKAVHHIREKQRLEVLEEERKVGRAHLASILDQSGAILETQQEDLTRGDIFGSRSRSGSIRDHDDEEDETEDDEEEEEDEEEGSQGASLSLHRSDDEEEEDDEEDQADDDEGTSFLLAGIPPTQSQSTRTSTPAASTPASVPSDLHTEDEQEVPTVQMPNGSSSALNALMMYSDSESETDLEYLVQVDPNSSPQRPPRATVLNAQDEGPDDSLYPMGTSDEQPVDDATSLTRSHSREVRFAEDEHDQEEVNETEVEPSVEPRDDLLDVPMQVDDEGPLTEPGEVDQVSRQHGEDQEEQAGEMDHEGAEEVEDESEGDLESRIPEYLKPYAVAPVEWDPQAKITPPLLMRGVLRPYQQSGLEWLASLHVNKLNGILADEMGLGKTIQTISLLAHLACDRGIWGPHLIIVPTSVLLNWEMEFKKFLPGFRVLSYHGSTKRRKELRQGWNDKHHFNVCITSYTLASRDAHIFKRKAWYYMILDEAHMIKNFKSQRWNILLMFRSYRRLLLTGTPLQNNLTELWALLQFLMSGANFANLREFGEWFSNPLEKAIEMGNAHDEETMQTVSKLHTVLRPYLLRRLKRDVEKELPSKFEHLTMCPLSKRQRFLYDEFMERAQTRDALDSGVYQKIANVLMQLRKVCNHPDLFEVRPIVTSFAMTRSAIADYEIKELLVRRQLLSDDNGDALNMDALRLNFIERQNVSLLSAVSTRYLDATAKLPNFTETLGEAPPVDTRTIAGYRVHAAYVKQRDRLAHWAHVGYYNKIRCRQIPIFSEEAISVVRRMGANIVPLSDVDRRQHHMERVDRIHAAVKSYAERAAELAPLVSRFAFVTPAVVARDLPRLTLAEHADTVRDQPLEFDAILHAASVKLQIAFPDPSLLQWDCGKLQHLATLLREKKAGGHRILIFTQMTRILDILEIFLNFHGYLYLRLDGATKIEDRQYITERFNADPRIFCFIASSRSGGVGINLTGADTVVFYDSDFNPQMDRQCEDRAHRIGQIRDVHIYRFVSQHTVEEAMLLKANQKRSLDELVIQQGAFDWRTLLSDAATGALTRALGEYEDVEDAHAAAVAAREEFSLVGMDEADFEDEVAAATSAGGTPGGATPLEVPAGDGDGAEVEAEAEEEEEEGGTVVEYMLRFVEADYEYFCDL